MILMRRAGGYTPQDQLEQLYANMRPEYRLYIRRGEITNASTFSAQVTDIEVIENLRRQEERKTLGPTVAATAYSRDDCCWRCKQRGHTRQDCRRPPRKFCSRCGKDGVLTRDCHPPAGNGPRAGTVAASTQPESE